MAVIMVSFVEARQGDFDFVSFDECGCIDEGLKEVALSETGTSM
jgi:hypothetical protein